MSEARAGITGVILVGGKSRRMGQDKALMPWEGSPLFERVLTLLKEAFAQVILVGDREERFAGYGVPIVQDIYPGSALGGLYTGLYHASTEYIFVAACDMPFPSRELLRSLCSRKEGYDVVVPRTPEALEPLFAVYAKSCLTPMQQMLEERNFRIYDLYPLVRTAYLAANPVINVNTPEELSLLAR